METQARTIACHMKMSDPDWIQTNGPQLRRLLLYSTELQDQPISKYTKIYQALFYNAWSCNGITDK